MKLLELTLEDIHSKPETFVEVRPYFIFKYWFDKGRRGLGEYNFEDLVREIAEKFNLSYLILNAMDGFNPATSLVHFFRINGSESELNQVSSF